MESTENAEIEMFSVRNGLFIAIPHISLKMGRDRKMGSEVKSISARDM
jgi:hypothetical protein